VATYLITLYGAGGELDRRTVDAKTDRELLDAVIDFIRDVEILRDGDTIKITAQTGR
jgi:hypothetical protein